MYMDVLRAIVGIEIFPVVSLVLFVTIFGSVLVWAARADPRQLEEYAALPLEGPTGTPGRPTDSPDRRAL